MEEKFPVRGIRQLLLDRRPVGRLSPVSGVPLQLQRATHL